MQPQHHNRARLLSLLLFALATFAPALSYDYFVQSIQSIMRRATAIVEIEVTGIQQMIDEHNSRITVVTAKVNEVLVGRVEDATIILSFRYLDYEGVNRPLNPRFTAGEKAIVPLVRIGEDWSVLGHDQGKFRITGNTIEGSSVTSNEFKEQIKSVAAGRSERINVPPRKKQFDGGTGDYSGDGISKLSGEFHLLQPFRWGPTSGTITFYINPANAVDKDGNALSFSAIREAIARAVDTWNNAVHSYGTFSVSYSQTNSSRVEGDGVSTITFESDAYLRSNGAAWTFHEDGIINEVDMAFNLSNRWNTNAIYPSDYTLYTHPSRGQIGPVDLEDVVAHELGHGVGLHHVGDAFSTYTLYPTVYEASSWWEKTWRRSLELGDKAGKIYQDPGFPSSTSQQNSKILLAAPASVSFLGDFTVPTGSSLSFESGKTINLNGCSVTSTGGTMSDAGGNTWNPDVSVKSGATLLGHYSSLASAILNAASGQTITVNGGNYTLEYEPEVSSGVTLILNSATVTLANGAILWLYANSTLQLNSSTLNLGTGALATPWAPVTIQANSSTITSNGMYIDLGTSLQATNSTFRFGTGAKLQIHGTLTATGANTFTSTGGQWYGIEFYNAPNGSYINESTIQNAQYGVFCRNTSLSLMNCHFVSCNTGVYTNTIFGTMGLQGNLFSGLGIGVDCANYASPAIEPSNTLRYNDYAVRSDATSQPMLGDPQGANSIHDNGWDVWSDYPGTIWARGNWWGSYPAMPFIRGTVDYSYELQFDPSNEKINLQTPPPASVAESPAASPEDTLGLSAYEALHVKVMKGETAMLEGEFEGVISQYANKLAGRMALALLAGLKEKQGADLSATLASAVSSYPGTAVGKTASLFKVGALVKAGRNQEAFDLAKTLIGEAGPLTLKEALYDAGSIAWYLLDKKAEGESYFRQLAEKYPGDPLTASGLATLGETPVVKGTAKAEVAPPRDFALLPAYPNPFNPQTVLRYTLPEGARVSLKVYDLLGREVASLVDGYVEQGYHEAPWNASSLSSGVYLARFTVSDGLGAAKFTKVTKLVLMK